MKVFAVVVVARQVDGEYIAIRTEKGFLLAGQADSYLKELKKTFVTESGIPKVTKLTTPHGEMECMCEAGVFEIEVEQI